MDRTERVRAVMEEKGIRQMIICNPADVLYLSGQHTNSTEHFMGILFSADGKCRLFTNPLFAIIGQLPEGMETVSVSRGEKDTDVMKSFLKPGETIMVDPMLQASFLLPLMKDMPETAFVPDDCCMSTVHAVKDPEEIRRMQISSQINDKVMGRLRSMLKEGITEKEIYDRLEETYRECGADQMAFAGVCFGENAAQPHHIRPEDRKLKKGDCVLFDIGGKYDGYCSDMTRTFFFGEVSEKQKKIYELVLAANRAAEAAVRPGVRFCDIDRAAREVIEQGGYGPYFVHTTGHGIGMEVHEAGGRVAADNETHVQAGNIFSVEPGIYLEGEFGVRIEDLVLVTEDGCRILNSFPKELEVIPADMAAKQ
ncbi:MAG TPA: Xaa-Pro peptidase family protein [Candidatus Eisenbergiella intestinipullorum]|nr:Xaa-Pro peptidase family protein [Candidatus Eisenbergiella intestinipullorum]